MKYFLALMVSLVVQNSLAENEIYNYQTQDQGCSNTLRIIEQIESGKLKSLIIIKANKAFHKYEEESVVCDNLTGATVSQNDGSQITCWAADSGPNQYALRISYVEPPRDPSDYGLQKNYTVERSLKGVIANWDQQRYYDGKPIYCKYISIP